MSDRTCETCWKEKDSCPDVLRCYGETGDCGHWVQRQDDQAECWKAFEKWARDDGIPDVRWPHDLKVWQAAWKEARK